MEKNTIFQYRLSKTERALLDIVADNLDRTPSELVRHLVKSKSSELGIIVPPNRQMNAGLRVTQP